ncbi:hypothetical protein MOMUL_27420 [Moorella mulderi DSM 14980]|uniref:Wadjet protein JetD C-terminal domain-containing protein n=1 Tax=Moorella mulderi DSM 14980 TaxID=1122241 RepID=A0A151ATH9_9FIRM|nr:hypothetical protein MOMUL_27420 [Moorella mulderi DSM 14980]
MLISKYEGSRSFQTGTPGKQRPQFAMKKSPLAGDYFDEMDHRKREAIHAVLAELAAAGVVEVTWPRFQEGRQVEKVYLNFDAIPRAYELAGLVPRAERIYRLRQVLAPLASHPWEWVRGWWAGVNAALGERKTAGLDLEDLDGYEELVKVLLALPELEDSTPERVFSQRVLGDSKAFEQRVKKRLLAILKSYSPEEYETDAEYLDSVGLTDNPKMVLVAGPFTFRVGGTAVDVGELPGGVGLAAHTVRVMEITAVTAPWVLLVENLTSYYQVVQGVSELAVPSREREGDRDLAIPAGLVVYTGGFPHRGVQLFLRRLQDYRESPGTTARPPVYHWGDLDYGGIRICEYIHRNLIPDLQPYLMDVTTYTRYLPAGIPFGDEYAARLRHLAEDPAYAPWHPLLQAMLEHRKWVEQESMGPGATPPVLPP